MAIYGTGQVKELTELVPGILNQLGPDSLASLRKLAESYQQISSNQQRVGGGAEKAAVEENDGDDDDVPDLVESFEVDEKKEGGENKLDELSESSRFLSFSSRVWRADPRSGLIRFRHYRLDVSVPPSLYTRISKSKQP